MQSKAKTVAEYLASLPADRREALQAVRQVILANLDADYEEGMQYGMIGYYVPHRVFPDGYHCDPKQPLPFAGLASQKGHLSLYLMTTYSPQGHAGGDWFRKAWLATGRKLDMGKACVRFQKVEDVALEVVGEAVRRVPTAKYVAHYVTVRPTPRPKAAKKAVKKTGKAASKTAKKTAKKAPARKPAARR